MKKSIPLGITVLVGMFFAFSVPVFALAQSEAEVVSNFDATYTLHSDSSFTATERITYDFKEGQKHGIYRYLPVSYATDLGKVSIDVSHIGVVDEAGQPYMFVVSKSNGKVQVKIGDPDVLVTGKKTYVLTYDVAWGMGYFVDYDELYWNVTGDGWNVPIEKASAKFVLPKAVLAKDIRAACYQGLFGSTARCASPLLGAVSDVDGTVEEVFASSTLALGPNEELTVAVGFPKGVVYEPTRLQKILRTVKNNWIVGVPLLVLSTMLYVWRRVGRDPSGRGTVVAEYDSPESLTPIELSTLLRGSTKNAALSGEIIYLATKGYLSITRVEKDGILFTGHDYELKKLKPSTDLPPYDKALYEGLFTTDTILLSELKEKFYTKLPAIKDAVMESLIEKKYFTSDPRKVTGLYIAAGIGLGIVVGVAGSALGAGALAIFSAIVSGVIVVVFAFVMPKVTKAGAVLKERIKGLKLYLNVAEKDRINFHNAPEKSPKLFETLLPFAMVLGVEAAWAKQFEGIYKTAPSWYHDPSGANFNSLVFVNSLHSFNTAASSTLASAPQGGSGSGGGGFSGGGGGGGGGGSW